MRPNELWTCPDTEPPGLAPGCQWCQLLGPFQQQEEGIGIASDVVKVEGEDPATPGCLRSVDTSRVGSPGTVTIPQYQFNITKQHTV